MIYKMPGNEWEKFANLRLLYTYMITHPGAKLLFMGSEFGQTSEWNYKTELDWHLLEYDPHKKLQQCVKDLNHLYKEEPALFEHQFEPKGFEWVALDHREESVIVFRRKGKRSSNDLLIILNMTPVVRNNFKVYAKGKPHWKEIYNSDDAKYWGTGDTLNMAPEVKMVDKKTRMFEINIHLPALGAVILK
jgi:1,4-alpha-glucan branching enzyme